jgi:peptide/nickel transport system permease protein
MAGFLLRRLLTAIPTLFVISVFTFIIIQLPPGDYVTSYAATLSSQGDQVSQDALAALRDAYGLDRSLPEQYWLWITNAITEGDLGRSFAYDAPVTDLILERLGYTVLLSVASLLFVWALALPIGVISARYQYSFFDNAATTIGFLGFAIPNFLLALILMWVGFRWFGADVGGLFSDEYKTAPWSWGRVWDLLSHLWIPMIVLGTAGAASLIRIMRANMLDELNQQYVETARAKGLPEGRLIWKYPVRVSLNPFLSTVGYALPQLVSGATLTAVVLSLPTLGPMLLRALLSQDMYLAGAILMIMSFLTVIGTLISDVLLAWLDPRIRYE